MIEVHNRGTSGLIKGHVSIKIKKTIDDIIPNVFLICNNESLCAARLAFNTPCEGSD